MLTANTAILENMNVYALLDSVGEGLIFADNDFKIIWFNQTARGILKKVGPFVGIENPDTFIGYDLQKFHGERQQRILINGPFPHKGQIKLFNRFTAQIVVDRLKDHENNETGFVLTWRDVTEYENVIEEGKTLMEEMYTPIIGTALDAALLIALTGTLTEARMESMNTKILQEASRRNADYAMFDFTGIGEIFEESISGQLNQIVESLRLMGTDSIFVGLSPKLVQHITLNGIEINVRTFQSFKQGIQYIWKEKGYQLQKISD